MIKTPIGNIAILINDEEITYTYEVLEKDDRLFSDINARYKILVPFKKSSGVHNIKCILLNTKIKGDIESGERLEAHSFYHKKVKLTIGAEGEFGWKSYDYDGDYLSNGISYCMHDKTNDRNFIFGIAWISSFTDDNDLQTWLMQTLQ